MYLKFSRYLIPSRTEGRVKEIQNNRKNQNNIIHLEGHLITYVHNTPL